MTLEQIAREWAGRKIRVALRKEKHEDPTEQHLN